MILRGFFSQKRAVVELYRYDDSNAQGAGFCTAW